MTIDKILDSWIPIFIVIVVQWLAYERRLTRIETIVKMILEGKGGKNENKDS